MYVSDHWGGRRVIEDELLNQSVLALIEKLHGKVERIVKHCKVDGMEVDAILFCRKVRERRIGVELKEYDYFRVIQQAVQRRRYFNYFYIITRGSELIGDSLRDLYRIGFLQSLFDRGIGWIIVDRDNKAWLLFSSTYLKCNFLSVGE
jgi:histidinol phosphatase-like enzyme